MPITLEMLHWLQSKSSNKQLRGDNIHPDERFLDKDLSSIAENIGSSDMEWIARRYLNFSEADRQHCRIDAQMKQCYFSYHYSYFILKLWVERNDGKGVHNKLFGILEEVVML